MQQASGTDRRSDGAAGETDALALRVQKIGDAIGLPCIAASGDIGSPQPIRGADGRPFAETLFRWVDPDLKYWEDRGFALRAFFIQAVRVCSEPFYFKDGKLASWRPHPALDAINRIGATERFGVGAAIVAPAYLPGGVIGAVVWATADTDFPVAEAFSRHAPELQALALHFVAADHDHLARQAASAPAQLTRREIQCLKWGAAGKTDAEIAVIMSISVPTVRFHITNAARKLDVSGRSQAIYRAATLGYVGSSGQH
ncbi:MAG: LuxR C-terminal-related transcriptional regulator [Hyphomonadaceae bacterium]